MRVSGLSPLPPGCMTRFVNPEPSYCNDRRGQANYNKAEQQQAMVLSSLGLTIVDAWISVLRWLSTWVWWSALAPPSSNTSSTLARKTPAVRKLCQVYAPWPALAADKLVPDTRPDMAQ